MQDLLQWNQHFGFDIISGLRPIVKIILENTEVKPQPLFFQKPIMINIFWIHFCNPKIAYHSYPQYKYFNNLKISKRYLSFSQNTEIELLQMIIDVIDVRQCNRLTTYFPKWKNVTSIPRKTFRKRKWKLRILSFKSISRKNRPEKSNRQSTLFFMELAQFDSRILSNNKSMYIHKYFTTFFTW